MKAQVGDYVRTAGGSKDKIVEILPKDRPTDLDEYVTETGGIVCEDDLTIDDVFLPSEVEL